MKSNGIDTSAYKAAFRTVDRVEEIGQKLIDAASRGRFVGAVKVTTLYLSDIRYRRMGKGNYLAQLFNIIFVSKKKRMEELGLET